MVLLLGIGLLAGIVTAISPCVLPVLPILLAGGASGRSPLRVIAGLVASFSVFTLFATWILDRLGLPQDTLRNLAIALLFVLAGMLLAPRIAVLVERPLAGFSRIHPRGTQGGGFLFGTTLGLVFVPCAGPVLATVTVVAANEDVGLRAILLTVFYAAGAALPMLAIAYGGRGTATRLRQHARSVRLVSGAVVAVVALGLVLHLDDHLATLTPGYTSFLQTRIEDNATAKRELAKVRGGGTALAATHASRGGLPDYGSAPQLHADGAWINSPPLSIAALHGKVVLVDFWTYSCINCLRTLPHLKAWWAAYHDKGLVIVGVHTPEFAFEHVTSNVRAAVKRLGVSWPVMQDNRYRTWDNYANQYWPAEYLIDRQGRVRHTHFGEGEYAQTEALIRRLLGDTGARARAVADATPSGLMTPESYLGYARLTNYVGRNPVPDRFTQYTFPGDLTSNTLAYDGEWRVGSEAITAGKGARLRLRFEASNVYIVMGGRGTVRALVDDKPAGTIHVDAQRLYTVRTGRPTDALLELRFSPGVQAYSFTFG
ncbi:MAG TPA: cytochrome c biogenesis protein DipZ [Gaiellaceae bacterium]|jgi:cytochrome c biogenesis protein CcdA/thiol-disulfide isomerase/thioredoxin|nr:cytochrome c biogenesis protein DipZ [Gaiellaceae bacterium]